VCVCVCVFERERESDIERNIICVCVCVFVESSREKRFGHKFWVTLLEGKISLFKSLIAFR